jgi:hypothetical protein
LRGTFAPFSRASFNPIAIACLRLLTFRPEPDFSVPRFRRRIALSTVLDAFFEYRLFAMAVLFRGAQQTRIEKCRSRSRDGGKSLDRAHWLFRMALRKLGW